MQVVSGSHRPNRAAGGDGCREHTATNRSVRTAGNCEPSVVDRVGTRIGSCTCRAMGARARAGRLRRRLFSRAGLYRVAGARVDSAARVLGRALRRGVHRSRSRVRVRDPAAMGFARDGADVRRAVLGATRDPAEWSSRVVEPTDRARAMRRFLALSDA